MTIRGFLSGVKSLITATSPPDHSTSDVPTVPETVDLDTLSDTIGPDEDPRAGTKRLREEEETDRNLTRKRSRMTDIAKQREHSARRTDSVSRPPRTSHHKQLPSQGSATSRLASYKIYDTIDAPHRSVPTGPLRGNGMRMGERGSLDIRIEKGGNVQRDEAHGSSNRQISNEPKHSSLPGVTRRQTLLTSPEEASPDHLFGTGRARSKYADLVTQASTGHKHQPGYSADTLALSGSMEFRDICARTEVKTKRTKRRRSEADSEPSNHGSVQVTPAKGPIRRGSFDQPGSRDRPVDLDDDVQSGNAYTPKDLPQNLNHAHATGSRPPINLDDGMEEIEAQFLNAKRHPKDQLDPRRLAESAVRSIREPSKPGGARSSPIQPSRILEKRPNDAKRARLHRLLPVAAQDDTRNKFKADRVSPIDDDVDELDGPRTVNKSPQRIADKKSQPLDDGTRSQLRERSPSDLRSTPFRREKMPELYVDGAAKDRRASRILVEGIYSSVCNFEGSGIELVWNSEEGLFYVEVKGAPLGHPNREALVTIGPVVRQWQACSPDGLQVRMRVPSGHSGNGDLGIRFRNWVTREECRKKLSPTKSIEYDQSSLDAGSKQRMFEKVVRDARWHAARPSHSNNIAPVEIVKPWSSKSPEKPAEDDEIKYEDEGEEVKQGEQAEELIRPRQKARDRMSSAVAVRKATGNSIPMPSASTTDHTFSKYFEQPRRSTRQSLQHELPMPRSTSPEKWTKVNNPSRWLHSVVYPPLPAMRRVTVDFTDLERLDEGEFLNDSVLSFALRRIEEKMLPEHRKDVYMFNTFFYSSLSTKNGRKAFNFDAVKRWTSKIDIFKYRYVVVPINLDLHWFVAIICNLPRLMHPDDDSEVEEVEEVSKVEFDQDNDDASGLPGPLPKSSPSPATHLSQLSLSDQDSESLQAQLSQREVPSTPDHPPSSGRKVRKKRQGPPLKKFKLSEPIIMTLDSFGHSRSTEIKYLKDYVSAEALDKHNVTIDARQRLQGLTVKGIPEQSNFCDCGVFVVGYIQEFAKNPRAFANKVLSRQLSESDFREFSPSLKRIELRNHLLELNKTQEEEHKARRRERKRNLANATTKSEVPSSSAGPSAADDKAASSPTKDLPPEATEQIPSHEPAKAPEAPHGRSAPPTEPIAEVDDLVVSPPRPLAEKHHQQAHIPNRTPVPADHMPERTYPDSDDEILINERPTSPAKSPKVVHAEGVQTVRLTKENSL